MAEEKDPKTVETEQKTKIASLEAEKLALEAKIAAGSGSTKELEDKFNQLSGQISLLTEAATQTVGGDTPPDIVSDPEKALDYHWQKRAKPILDASTQREALREKEMIALKRAEDWGEFKDHVEAFVAKNKVSVETLATPGAYAQILDLVKSQHVEEIVKKKVAKQVADFQTEAARVATEASGGGMKASADKGGKNEPDMTDEEKEMASKLGVDPKKWIETAKGTTFDGIRTRGPVVH